MILSCFCLFGCGSAALRPSQCKRGESRISSNIFILLVFSALVASLRLAQITPTPKPGPRYLCPSVLIYRLPLSPPDRLNYLRQRARAETPACPRRCASRVQQTVQ
jgi:hypothetical protein